MKLHDLMGKHVLQGIELGIEHFKDWGNVDNQRNYILFRMDDVTYKATEDPDDGYRSYCGEIETVDKIPEIKLPDIEVYCNIDVGTLKRENEILEFIDAINGERFMRIGTEDINDYYPGCILEYEPEKLYINEFRGK